MFSVSVARQSLRVAAIAVSALIVFAPTLRAAPTNLLGIYEETGSATNCVAVSTCRVDFSTLIAPINITKVSCNFFFSSKNYNDVFLTAAVLGNASSNKVNFTPVQYLNPVSSLQITATTNQFQLLADTLHVVPAQYRPSVEINVNKPSNIQVYCSISGTKS